MEKSSFVAKLVSLMIISMLVNSPQGIAINCNEVRSDLLPCAPYIMFGGVQVPEACCNGLRTLMNHANTTPDRQNVCSCLKSAASAINDEQLQRAAGIPGICHVSVNFNFTRDVDCSKVDGL